MADCTAGPRGRDCARGGMREGTSEGADEADIQIDWDAVSAFEDDSRAEVSPPAPHSKEVESRRDEASPTSATSAMSPRSVGEAADPGHIPSSAFRHGVAPRHAGDVRGAARERSPARSGGAGPGPASGGPASGGSGPPGPPGPPARSGQAERRGDAALPGPGGRAGLARLRVDDEIERPMEGMEIADLELRERAWRKLAKRLYDAEPEFMERGKRRWQGRVRYCVDRDRVLFNDKPLPNSRLWRSTFDHRETGGRPPNMGKVIMVLMEKNESKIIARMLDSLVHDIDGFIVLDTGSTDGTEQVIWDVLVTKHKKPGAIYRTDWYDFGTNRTVTVQLAHGAGDWLLLVDGDYKLSRKPAPSLASPSPVGASGQGEASGGAPPGSKTAAGKRVSARAEGAKAGAKGGGGPAGAHGGGGGADEARARARAWKAALPEEAGAPAWLLLKTTGDLDYSRPHLVRGDVLWCYVCRTHEYLSRSVHDTSTRNFAQAQFEPLLIDHVGDGQSKADKLGRDIVLLLMDRMDDPRSERAPYYLANTLKHARMVDWALREYKAAMNLCAWNEELMCSAKGALECMFMKPGGVSFERVIAMALHGMSQNPERLEIPCLLLRKLRNTDGWWPKCSHLASCLAAFFAHNTYPSHQKLFIERPDHEFGWWNEVSIACYYSPVYFELGLYICTKLPTLPAFATQHLHVRRQCESNLALYRERLDEWRRRGVGVTPAVRKHLLEQGHRAYAQGKFTKAKEMYQYALHPLVVEDALPPEMWTATPADRRTVELMCDNLATLAYHQRHRLTAWANARCSAPPPASPEARQADADRALACFQIGQCQLRLLQQSQEQRQADAPTDQPRGERAAPAAGGAGGAGPTAPSAAAAAAAQAASPHQDTLIAAMHFVDALKFVPSYPPALAALYELTLRRPSDLTRCVTYLIRLTSMSQAAEASVPIVHAMRAAMEGFQSEQSEFAALVSPAALAGTSWIVPLPSTPPPAPARFPEWQNVLDTAVLVLAH
jgi:hypothetical protein